MSAGRWRTLLAACVIAHILGIFPGTTTAEESGGRNGFVVGGWAGFGRMDVNTDAGTGSSHGTLSLGGKGGYAITRGVVAGLELNGWTLKGYDLNDPSRGETASNISVFLNLFPFHDLPIYLAGGGGKFFYTNNSPGVNGRDEGGSWFVGGGYEYPVSKNFKLVPQLRYGKGNFSGGDFHVYELALGVNFYSGSLE